MATGLVIPFIVILIAATALEYTLMRRDLRKYPGKLIDIGGLRLHVLSMGEDKGLPPVILESSSLGFSAKWDMVQREAARFAQIYSYDRAGYGWSDDPLAAEHRERSDQVIVQELHDLITNAEIPTPCILVGHEIGGQYARQFARLYPDLVAGLVLVDSFHPAFWSSRLQVVQEMLTSRLLSFIGLVRLDTWFRYRNLPMSPAAKSGAIGLHSHAMLYSGTREIKLIEPDVEIENVLDDKPVVVVIRAMPNVPQWKDFQSDFLKLSSNSRLVEGDYTGSLMHLGDPQTIVKGIRLAVDAVRSGKALSQ